LVRVLCAALRRIPKYLQQIIIVIIIKSRLLVYSKGFH